MRATWVLLALLVASPLGATPARGPTGTPAAPATFEELLGAVGQAEARGDSAAVARAIAEIRRVRIERNVERHEVLGLAFVREGVRRMGSGDREGAEAAFREAVTLSPGLPDAHFGLAWALLRKGVLGVVPSFHSTLGGVTAYLGTARGEIRAFRLLAAAMLLCGFALAWTLALVLMARSGGLLRHDIEERMAARGRRSWTLAVLLAVALLPVLLFQGWGWLPLWWLALLFVYLDRAERLVALAILLGTLVIGPGNAAIEHRLRTVQNPLFSAALAAIEEAPGAGDLQLLAKLRQSEPDDRDLQYLLAAAYRRRGHYDEAAEVYRSILAADPKDPLARNNLANLDFIRGAYGAALARYREGAEGGGSPEFVATSYHNLSLAHLQKFDYQAYNEAKSNADRLARPLVQTYDRWKYDSGDYAVVDLVLTPEQLWAKLAGVADGVGRRNVVATPAARAGSGFDPRSALGRFAAAVALLALVALLVSRWRGAKAFTVHCAKCGAAFCRFCHLAHGSGGLCSQCYHLYVVRDGVSGPARNRKMAEVQRAERRRDLWFRALSVVAPGAGQVYAGRILLGLPLLALWYAPLSLALASRIVPLTDASDRLVPLWPLFVMGAVLIAVWVVANRFRPDFDVHLPVRRPAVRRARTAPGA